MTCWQQEALGETTCFATSLTRRTRRRLLVQVRLALTGAVPGTGRGGGGGAKPPAARPKPWQLPASASWMSLISIPSHRLGARRERPSGRHSTDGRPRAGFAEPWRPGPATARRPAGFSHVVRQYARAAPWPASALGSAVTCALAFLRL